MVHNPGGDWNPGWGVDLIFIHISVDLLRHHNPPNSGPKNESIDLENTDLEADEERSRGARFARFMGVNPKIGVGFYHPKMDGENFMENPIKIG